MPKRVRKASHAGSWYSDSKSKLGTSLEGWLGDAKKVVKERASAIVSPHAGYSYSGPTAGWAFKHVPIEGVKRVFVLGPSHRVYLDGCALSAVDVCETPVGNLKVDKDVMAELRATGEFVDMSLDVDEAEHSIEMQLPYLAWVFKGTDVKIVPIMVGSISGKKEAKFGRLLAPYVKSSENFFVCSSDFCHWGDHFDYKPHNPKDGEIHEHIKLLDHAGMKAAQEGPDEFRKYLRATKNTICGRHPITVYLEAVKAAEAEYNLSWVKYARSNLVKTASDSSVSYASGVFELDIDGRAPVGPARVGGGGGGGAA